MNVLQFVYPFKFWRTFGFSVFGRMYKGVFVQQKFSVHVGKFLGLAMLSYVVSVCLTLLETGKLFFQWWFYFAFQTSVNVSSYCCISSLVLKIINMLIWAILLGVYVFYYVLICNLITDDQCIFSCVYFPIEEPLWCLARSNFQFCFYWSAFYFWISCFLYIF